MSRSLTQNIQILAKIDIYRYQVIQLSMLVSYDGIALSKGKESKPPLFTTVQAEVLISIKKATRGPD